MSHTRIIITIALHFLNSLNFVLIRALNVFGRPEKH